MMQFLVFPLLFLSAAVSASSQHVRYVKPDHHPSSCPGQPCLTLDQYTSQATTYFTTGSTFLFLAGNHSVHSTLRLKHVSEILFTGCKNCSVTIILYKTEPVIQCDNVYSFTVNRIKFLYHTRLHIKVSLLKVNASKGIKLSNLAFFVSSDLKKRFLVNAASFWRSDAVIISSHFKGSTDGALFVSEGNNITIDSCIFEKNIVRGDGGALHVSKSSRITITHCLFEENIAYRVARGSNGNGGALYVSDGSNITIASCNFEQNTAEFSGGALYVSDGSNVTIASCNFERNTGFAGGALDVFKRSNITIVSCNFERNTAVFFGGALKVSESNGTIASCNFERNTAEVSHGGALRITYESNVTIESCNFESNTADYCGGALNLLSSNVIFSSCVFGGVTIFHNNSAELGGAIYSESSTVTVTTRCTGNMAYHHSGGGGSKVSFGRKSKDSNSALSDCKTGTGYSHFQFSDNHAEEGNGDISLGGAEITTQHGGELNMSHSVLRGPNMRITGNSGSAICAFSSNFSFNGDVYIGMNNGWRGGGIQAVLSSISFTGTSVFEENHASEDGGAFWMQQSTISFLGYTQLQNSTAAGNGGAGFVTDASTISIWDNVTFSFNRAKNGGALFFQNGATIKLNLNRQEYCSYRFNHASKYGGAIYHSDSITPTQCEFAMSEVRHDVELDKLPLCFIQAISDDWETLTDRPPISAFIGNSASVAGSVLYGGLLDKCKMLDDSSFLGLPFEYLLHMKSEDTTKSISSRVYQLCFCQSIQLYKCSPTKTVTIHRGERITVSLLALAQRDTSSSTTVRSKLSPTARLNPNQLLQDIPDNCTELSYNLYSSEQMEQLILYPDGGPCGDIGAARATIIVTFLPCPNAFTLSGDQCVCEERLQAYDVECKISDDNIFIVRKTGSRVWMKAIYSNETYHGLILYPTCPMGYCKNETVVLLLLDLDLQCDQNRSGLLCGGCATNHSLMLGSSGCRRCPNASLSLLLPFAAAGIALVVFLTLLRLTVATGMINSVILYANIVQANKDTLFFSSSSNNVLKVFIAWMNLDLGFHTCFYDGMDAFAQTWLQFVFPVYIWILTILIILTSRYSVTVTKLIGSNPIAVLATLLLMSYNKLLKIIIEVYSSVDLEYPGNKRVTVWLKDSNEPYLQSRHLVLAVVTTLFLVFLFLPYTLLLLLGYKLYRFAGRKHITRWLIRIKPFLDSYYAPYKMHTRYWTGLLLLVRCALYIVFSYNSLGDIKLSLLAIIIAFAATIFWPWLTVKVYLKSLTNTIEAVVYLNLIVLSACIAIAGIDSPILVDSLVGMVFVIMMGIIIYHFHILYIAKSALWLKLRAKITALRAKPTETMTPLLAPAAGAAPPQGVPAANAPPPRREPIRSVINIRELLQADNEQPTS